MGETIISGISETELVVPAPPTTNGTLLDSLTYLFNLVIYSVNTFSYLVLISTEFTLLFVFIVFPLSVGFLWALVELARGN